MKIITHIINNLIEYEDTSINPDIDHIFRQIIFSKPSKEFISEFLNNFYEDLDTFVAEQPIYDPLD